MWGVGPHQPFKQTCFWAIVAFLTLFIVRRNASRIFTFNFHHHSRPVQILFLEKWRVSVIRISLLLGPREEVSRKQISPFWIWVITLWHLVTHRVKPCFASIIRFGRAISPRSQSQYVAEREFKHRSVCLTWLPASEQFHCYLSDLVFLSPNCTSGYIWEHSSKHNSRNSSMPTASPGSGQSSGNIRSL